MNWSASRPGRRSGSPSSQACDESTLPGGTFRAIHSDASMRVFVCPYTPLTKPTPHTSASATLAAAMEVAATRTPPLDRIAHRAVAATPRPAMAYSAGSIGM